MVLTISFNKFFVSKITWTNILIRLNSLFTGFWILYIDKLKMVRGLIHNISKRCLLQLHKIKLCLVEMLKIYQWQISSHFKESILLTRLFLNRIKTTNKLDIKTTDLRKKTNLKKIS